MESARPPSKAWTLAVTFLVLAVLLRLLSRTVADPDLWGHVLYGLEHLREGSLARTDPYSYLTAGHEWINHEWVSELIFGFLYATFGPVALIVFKTALALTVVGLLYRHLWRQGLDPLRAGLAITVVAFALVTGLGTVRPQMFTHLFFALLLLALVAAEEGTPRRLWWAPVLLLLWINFHGGVLAGLGVLAIWSGTHLLLRLGGRRLGYEHASPVTPAAAVGVTAASAVALLANPYGWRLPDFLFRTATVPRPEILDWQPLAIWSVEGAVYLLLVGVTVLAIARSRRTRNLPLLAVLTVTAVLPLLAMRHLQLFAIAFPVLAGGHLADAWVGRRRAPGRPSESRLRPMFTGIAGAAGLVMILASIPNFGCIRVGSGGTMDFPTRATALLKESGVSGNLAVTFGWGQYAIWHLHPAMRVSMDGRRETVYPDDVYRRYLRFHYGVSEWDEFIEDPPADLALLPTGGVPYNLLSLKPGWTLAHRDSTAAVFVRDASPRAGMLLEQTDPSEELEAVPADGAGLCFPVSRLSRSLGR